MADKYYVGVSDRKKYEKIKQYNFYIHYILHDFTQDDWVRIDNTTKFTLDVTRPCKYFIYFKPWEVQKILPGTIRGDIQVQRNGDYFSGSNNTVDCPMYNYSVEVIKGDPSLISMNNATGELYAKSKTQDYTLVFTICGTNSTNNDDCITSEPRSFSVVFQISPKQPLKVDADHQEKETV